jgi:hypothetical protein
VNIKRKMTTAVAICGLAFAGITAASAPAAHATTYLGGVSVLGACENQIFTNGVALINNTVTGWRCEYNGAVLHVIYYNYNIHLNEQCAYQYGSGAYAGYTNYYNPYSWGCYR